MAQEKEGLAPLHKDVIRRFQNRLKVLRNAQSCSQAGKIANAVENYKRYLGAVAAFHRTKESLLAPGVFDPQRDIPEMLLISQVYWDLAKIYSCNPNMGDEVKRGLGKFTEFSMGKKFQYLNAEMLRKFIKKQCRNHKKLFEDAYTTMRVKSKKCYIATYCYGASHPNLDLLRNFKLELEQTNRGIILIETYYRISPHIVNYCEQHPRLGRLLSTYLFKPAIKIASMFIRRRLR
ncbi:MAG: hypothetical protein HN482_07050 [Bdellovibrionales bacterium]|nr:hypothetical protein [Bdellovibrionales bacterium]